MSNHDPKFPLPLRHRGRIVFLRSDLERYKRELIVAAAGGRIEDIKKGSRKDEPESFVIASDVAKELGMSRRTLGRIIASASSEPEAA